MTTNNAMNDNRIAVHFHAYQYNNETLFQFWLYDGKECWNYDGVKRTFDESVKRYPFDEYKWISIDFQD